MISEKFFVKNYNSFWKSIFPLSNIFMKGVTIECIQKVNESTFETNGRRFSFVSEIGFNLFARALKNADQLVIDRLKQEDKWYKDIEEYCASQFEIYRDDLEGINLPLDRKEFSDAKIIAFRLKNFFDNSSTNNIIVSPQFNGCGFLNNSFGDIIFNSTLYEIKSVSRNFNIQDFKQLMTYCILNYASKQYNIENVGLFNPKNNSHYKINIDSFCNAVSGTTFSELSWKFINFISEEQLSK